ncbi:MAG: sigma 54-interacting transcriptional regulator [Vicinamibacterales bacterium]
MMTAHGTVESAVEAMKLGARDYLQKPFDVEELLVVIRRALEDQRARQGLRYLLSERDLEFHHYGIVGRSRAIRELLTRAEQVAASRSAVLLTGETGTGKELVARAIHARSAQADHPLIKVNCAAIPETLLESELFGHTRGAFTGATTTKRGRFALADGGTIFLDELPRSARPCRPSCSACCRSASSSRSGRAHAAGGRAGDRGQQSGPSKAGGRGPVSRTASTTG